MPLSEALRELSLLVRSRYGLIVLDAPSEERTAGLLASLAAEVNLPLFTWNSARGLSAAEGKRPAAPLGRGAATESAGGGGPGVYGTQPLEGALDHLRTSERPALYAFEGALGALHDGAAPRLLEVARKFARSSGALILLSGGEGVELPPALLPHCAVFRLPEPQQAEYRALLERVRRDLGRTLPVGFELTPPETERLLQGLRGFSLLEAEKILTRLILEDGKLGPDDLPRLALAKRAAVEREGLLSYQPARESLRDVAGFARLKAWLSKRAALFERPAEARAFGLSFPRGILLLGVPGVGKSLAAKAVATEWGLPLLKLDPGALYSKYVGETERNFRRATRTAERLSPVVLWIDEIEKAFAAGGEEDGGASRRALGSFLSWLQERAGDVFVVATANDLARVPPELLRKGRFDELFFLDLPSHSTRAEILRLHLQRRGHDPALLDLDALAASSEHFSGAELEAALIAALYTAFARGAQLSTELVLGELRASRPLALTRAEDLTALRDWARERAVNADEDATPATPPPPGHLVN